MRLVPNSIKKVLNTLPQFNRRDVMTFFVCVLIATLFWFVQSAYKLTDTTLTVTLNIEGQPAGAVFTTHVPSELKVTLYDSNIQLLKYGTNSNFRTLTVDFNRYADVAGNFRISGAELQSLLLNELSSTTQITAISPALIDARYALTSGKKVPVRLNAHFSTRGNFKNFSPQLQPDSVLVHAPNYILDTLTHISTIPFEATDLHDSLLVSLPLELNVGVKSTPDSVSVLVPVMQYVDKRFEAVSIQVIDLPQGKQLVLFPHTVSMSCLANFSHYNSFTADDFVFSVSYLDLKADPKRQFLPVSFSTKLSDSEVYGIRFWPNEVEFTLEER